MKDADLGVLWEGACGTQEPDCVGARAVAEDFGQMD